MKRETYKKIKFGLLLFYMLAAFFCMGMAVMHFIDGDYPEGLISLGLMGIGFFLTYENFVECKALKNDVKT